MRWPFAVLLALAALPGGRLASQQPAKGSHAQRSRRARAASAARDGAGARRPAQCRRGDAFEPRLVSTDRDRQRVFPENWRDPVQLLDQPNADASRLDGLQRRTERESGAVRWL